MLVGFFEERKSFLLYRHQSIRFYDVTFRALNSKLLIIKVVHHKVDSGQSFEKSNLFLHEQVSTLSLENLVRLFLNHDDDIACLSAWDGVRLTVENVLFSIGTAFVDLNFENLLFLLDFGSLSPTCSFRVLTLHSRL